MEDCLFCSIASGAVPALLLGKNDGAVAFLDIHPCAKGHTVVIPRVHAETIAALPTNAIPPLFSMVQQMVRTLTSTLHPDGFTIGVNHGREAGQAVMHLHVHVIPRWHGDGGGSVHTVVRHASDESLDAVYQQIMA
jgi:histidine triad (HIT) family protein